MKPIKMITCIKQVPGTTIVDIDEETGVLKREGIEAKMNPYDLYAIETALKLREQHGGVVTAITLGPLQSRDILKEAYMMGVDDCTFISDKSMAGADVLATSYALSGAIKKLGAFDLIICGKQTTDGDTAQVGAEIAEFLGIPHATNVIRIIQVEDALIRMEMDMGDYVQVQNIPYPCLITVDKDIYMPRLPSYKNMLKSMDKEICMLALSDLEDDDPAHYGLSGSPTQVERVFPPESSANKIDVRGTSEEIAEFLYQRLKEQKFV